MRIKVRRCSTVVLFFIMLAAFNQLLSDTVLASSSILVNKAGTSSRTVALTFDDSESSVNLYAVLKILEQNNIKATFFITGKGAAQHPDLVKAVSEAGHEIGSHSYSHVAYTSLSYSQIQSDLSKADETITNITGKSAKPLFRPPYGYSNASVLKAVGDAGYTKTVTWNIDTKDWSGASASYIYNTVINNISPGSIILMHCNAGAVNTKYALQNIIDKLRANGYNFTTVSSLLAGMSDGWHFDSGKWQYFRDGVPIRNSWAKDSHGWCYIGNDSFWVEHSMWAQDSYGWCYIGDDGYWVQHSMWAKDSHGWCFIKDDGYWDGNVPLQSAPS